jgi:tetratricopeptide (TPR) repeat protein
VRRDPWRDELLARRQGHRAEFLRSLELLERGATADAIRELEALRARRPGDVLVLLSLHRAYRIAGDLEHALALLLEARRADPLRDVVHLHLAGAYRERAHRSGGAPERASLESALASSVTACELAPTHAAAHGMRGDVLAELGRGAEALEAWVRAAELGRGDPMWQEKAGLALCQAGRWAEAVPKLRQLDSLRPRSARTLLQLAAALANSGQIEEARAPLAEARALAPDDPMVRKAYDDLERTRAGMAGSAARR